MEQKFLYIKRESEDFLSVAKSSVYVGMCEKSNSLNIIKKYVYTYTQTCVCVCVCLQRIRNTGL